MRLVETDLRGRRLLAEASLNKGTAFTGVERQALGLDGLLPGRVETIEDQLERIRVIYDGYHNDLQRHVFLRSLQDANEVLFHRFLRDHLTEMMPIVYTPTVGEACRHFSRIYRRPYGLFLSYELRNRVSSLLDSAPNDVDVIVVTDGERTLGLGDQGLGGMGIAIGKLSLYTAIAGIDPRRTLPILLDVGTNNAALREDPLYLGWRHERVEGERYHDFVSSFVGAVRSRWPRALLQWEDFANHNATELLQRHRNALPSFNDDIQGTAAVALATVQAALGRLEARVDDARVVICGGGSAGTGIAAALVGAGVAKENLYLLDSGGLLHDRRGDLADFKAPFAQRWVSVDSWANSSGPTDIDRVVDQVAPTVLIGVSGQPGLFGESLIRRLADLVDRPIVLPLSNPTSRTEATPAELLAWTAGRALVATGSPFDDVTYGSKRYVISQANNVYVFPGLGLGTLAAGAAQVTDGMFEAAAEAVAKACARRNLGARSGILPPLSEVIELSRQIAFAVAVQARADGVADPVDDEIYLQRIEARRWDPQYPQVRPLSP
ncbi:MAG: NAD-dependent malic enzyme [Actinomycetota bacterium]